jgi:ATP-dependent DNA helicase RecQ
MTDYGLKQYFGFDHFFDGQREVVEKVAAGESAVAIFPTGGGKSLCYQLPAMHLAGITLVVSPLLSLMKDQLEFLQSKKIPAAKLDSGMGRAEYHAALQDAIRGRIRILMVSVERFKNERFRGQLKRMKVSLLVVDEAHCISEWGHNFRPDYLKIPIYQKEFHIPQVLLLTATAPPKVVEDMCAKFGISRENVISTGFFRKNLHLRVASAPEGTKRQVLLESIQKEPSGPAIVYVTLQKTAENVAQYLSSMGVDARAYHAGMKTEQREEIQNRFMHGSLNTVVATIAFGMGIDKRNIRKVIHYDLPKSIEGYSQEIGRAGRDGQVSVCTLIGNRSNVSVLENFVYGDTPEVSGIRHVLEVIRENHTRQLEIRLYRLSMESDIRLLPLKTLLVYLEMDGIIKPRYTYFESYPFRLVKTAAQITEHFSGERRDFVETIFRHTGTAQVWSYPEIEQIIEESGSDRARVLAALEYFDEKGWIELQPKTSVEVYEILTRDFDVDKGAQRLSDLFRHKEAIDVDRIHRMISLFESSGCLAVKLSRHFGETIAQPCGNCTFCLTGKPSPLQDHPPPAVDHADVSKCLQELRDLAGQPVSDDLAARFLCGIATPRLTRLRARQLGGFGRFEKYPYKEVRRWAREAG